MKLRQIEGFQQAPGTRDRGCNRDGGTPVETILCSRESELEALMRVAKVIFISMNFIFDDVRLNYYQMLCNGSKIMLII